MSEKICVQRSLFPRKNYVTYSSSRREEEQTHFHMFKIGEYAFLLSNLQVLQPSSKDNRQIVNYK